MALVADGIQMNTHSVAFAFTVGTVASTVNINEVEDLTFDRKSTPVLYQGDNADGPTHKKNTDNRREIKVIGAARNKLAQIPLGVFGVLTWVEDDFRNGASTGAFNGTLINCSLDDESTGGKHNEVRMNTASFSAYWAYNSTAGTYTDPFSYTITT